MRPLTHDEWIEWIEWIESLDDTMKNREIAVRLAREAASDGDGIAGSLAALENAASPFYLGLDSDPDSSDMDVFP